MKLDRWIIYGDVLVGYIYDSKLFKPGTRVMTEAIRYVDPINMEAECLDGKYKLAEPGTAEEHRQELIGKPKSVEMPEIETKIFLNPRG